MDDCPFRPDANTLFLIEAWVQLAFRSAVHDHAGAVLLGLRSERDPLQLCLLLDEAINHAVATWTGQTPRCLWGWN